MNLQRFASTILLVLGGTIPSFCTDDLLASFLGKATFEKQRLFDDQRYPNVVATNKGTILSVWGDFDSSQQVGAWNKMPSQMALGPMRTLGP